MKKIALSGKYGENKYAIIDDEDFELASKRQWSLSKRGFIYTRPRVNGKLGKYIRLHRLILKEPLDSKKRIYYINGNYLDIRKSNLRIVDMNLARLLDKLSCYSDNRCWEWPSGMSPATRYGMYNASSAHRAVYEYFKGRIPKGLVIDHICFNRICVNPNHLEAVTQKVNVHRSLKQRGFNYA